MIDNAAVHMQNGRAVAVESIESVNDNTMQSHFHHFYEIFYLEKGVRTINLGERSFDLSEDDFIIFPPYSMHRSFSEQDINFKRTVVYFTPDLATQWMKDKIAEDLSPHYIVDKRVRTAFRNLIGELIEVQQQGRNYYQDKMSFMLGNLLYDGLMADSKKHSLSELSEQKIATIINYIHQNYNLDLTLAGLAEQFYISQGYLCREFKRFTNCTFVEYINKIRISHAQRLFLESDKSLTAIANEVGFGSLTHFERVFAKINNITPKKMCKQMRLFRDQKDHSKRASAYIA